MRLKSAGKAKRHPLWSKEQFLEDLRKYRTIKKVCEIYADKEAGWQAYNSDQWRWRKADPELDAEVKAILAGEGTDRPDNGRPRNDKGDKSWQEDYCRALIENRLALDRAAAVTPYSVRQIEDFIDPVCSSYDENFAKMVREAELTISSRSREALVSLQDESSWEDFETSKISQSKAWFHFKMAEKLEPTKFGRRQVEVTGTIDHRHQHRLMPKEERLALLDEDRVKYIKSKISDAKRLESGDVIEAEVIKDA